MSKAIKKSPQFKMLGLELKLLDLSISDTVLLRHFILSNRKLEFSFVGYDLPIIPKSLFMFENLGSLDLQSNNIERIFDELGNLKKLNRLNLDDNKLVELPDTINILRFLEIIKLKNNNLNEINIDFNKFTYLSILDLANNNIRSIPASLSKCAELEELNLSNNQISKLFDFENLKQLHTLKLNDNNIVEIPDTIGHISALKILDISNNNIDKIPSSILLNIDEYVIFNASGNNMQEILVNIDQSVYEKLLMENQYKFTKIIDEHPKLFEYISFKQLITLYIEMRINDNNITLSNIANFFSFNNNRISINLTGMRIDYFPISLTSIKFIHSLSIPVWLLKTLPTKIEHLANLKILKCWNSINNTKFVLDELPSTIVKFSELEELNLWFNKLKRIPKIIGNLVKLRVLTLAYNKITYLPQLTNLHDLEVLDLRGMKNLNVHVSNSADVNILRD